MNKRGINVCGIDNQGCGLSEGLHSLRFYVESFDHYVQDSLQFSSALSTANDKQIFITHLDGRPGGFQIPSQFSSVPLFISGISLGGCIAYTAALRHPSLYSGAILLAPMLSLEKVSRKGLNPYLRPLATILSYIVPTAAIVATDKNVLYPDIQVSH